MEQQIYDQSSLNMNFTGINTRKQQVFPLSAPVIKSTFLLPARPLQ